MFSYKFVVIPDRKNAVRLRLFNNGRKSEINMGISMSQEDLDKIVKGGRSASATQTAIIRHVKAIALKSVKWFLVTVIGATLVLLTNLIISRWLSK